MQNVGSVKLYHWNPLQWSLVPTSVALLYPVLPLSQAAVQCTNKLLRLSDMNEPNPAILSASGSEHDKKWLRHETHQDLCVLQRLDIRYYQKHHLPHASQKLQ
jgi:hypothetical protein